MISTMTNPLSKNKVNRAKTMRNFNNTKIKSLKKTRGYIQNQRILRNPKNQLKSDRYNFLQPIIDAIDEDDLPRAIEATWDLTAAIMSVTYDNRQGRNRRYQNMSNVYFFISEMCKTVNGKMPLENYLKTIPSSHPARGLLAISEVAPSNKRKLFHLRINQPKAIHKPTHMVYDQ